MRFQQLTDYTLAEPGEPSVPIYTYTCTACNDLVEKRQSFSDPPLTTCEQCGGALRKVIHPVGIVFKGSGWYITDSRSSSAAANGRTNSTTSSDGEAKSSDSGSTSKDSGGSSSSGSSDAPKSSSSSAASSTPSKTD
jgi:putative FmdB family regulatory protein